MQMPFSIWKGTNGVELWNLFPKDTDQRALPADSTVSRRALSACVFPVNKKSTRQIHSIDVIPTIWEIIVIEGAVGDINSVYMSMKGLSINNGWLIVALLAIEGISYWQRQ